MNRVNHVDYYHSVVDNHGNPYEMRRTFELYNQYKDINKAIDEAECLVRFLEKKKADLAILRNEARVEWGSAA